MTGLPHRRFHLVQRRPTKSCIIICILFISYRFTTAIHGFSPFVKHSRIRPKQAENVDIIRKSQIDSLVGTKSQRCSSVSNTSLRGGFMLPLAENPLFRSIGIYAFADFVVGFLISIFTGSHVHLDLIGTGVFAVAALPYLGSSVAHIRWSSAAIFLWGMKLALFLFFRATQVKHDIRLMDVLASPKGVFQFWFSTFLWNVLVSLPFLLGLNSDRDNRLALFSGGALFLLGLTIESVSDAQKYIFKRQPSTGINQFCNVGLWKYSQHPNWFGNLLLWTGILLMNFPALIEPMSTIAKTENETGASLVMMWLWSLRKLLLACLGPGFLWALFKGQATGNILNSVELANTRYGKNPEYGKYIKEVPLIIPKLKFW